MLNLSDWLSTKLSIPPVCKSGKGFLDKSIICSALPYHFDWVTTKLLVARNDRQPLGGGLGDQHPVKWIFVNGWQTCEDRNAGGPDGEDDAAAEIRCAR